MPNAQIDNLKLIPKINHRFVEVCLEIVNANKLSGGPYKSARALCQSVGMSEQSFFLLKSDAKGRSVTVAKIAYLVRLHNVNANYLFTGRGPKFITAETNISEVEQLTQAVLNLQKQITQNQTPAPASKPKSKKR